ncbi:MAG TPA: DUF87 domain-containing protein [Chthoniobacteraceae bacterium]|nr:DUF87 domain-containing protein [Chthoniobacteraceae bacterium]
MSLNAEIFEKMGAFYLGRPVDPETGQPPDADASVPFLYDSTDLTTHAVCVGMTGSGKTGLCVTLLEEAAIDGIPSLIIDPKGDMTNLALRFPRLRPSDFRPWISPDAAQRAGVTPDAFAEGQAKLWSDGLARWGEDGERIARLEKSAEVVVYTPGSTAGVPVSVIHSLECPPEALLDDPELLADQVETVVASFLGLLDLKVDATRSREGVLLSALLHDAWTKRQPLDLAELARRIQKPPFAQVGVLDLEAFYPEKERFQLVLALNTLLASPGFALWRQGVPLDVGQLLYTKEGRPRMAVFSIAHLSDTERMFFVSMLLGATLAWTRQQSGTTSLRALLYMDEVFGYFPPTANPPSKKPLLTLMKQARAFGLGVVVATQNPADLDYKGLSNAGTWFIGRLQTERDKLRLLDGLGGIGVDQKRLTEMLGRLGKRIFLMNNVHENEPVLFETRWALSYLCGPLTREQIRRLPRPEVGDSTAPEAPAATASRASLARKAEAATAAARPHAGPPMVSGIRQIYPRQFNGSGVLQPVLVGVAKIRYRDVKAKLDLQQERAFGAAFPQSLEGVAWAEAEALDLNDFDTAPPARAEAVEWGEVPPEGVRAASYDAWKREFASWLVNGQSVTLLECPANGMLSQPGESESEFRIRLGQQFRETRDADKQALRGKYARLQESLEKRLRTAEERTRSREAQAGESRMQTLISVGSTLVSMFLGRKRLSATTLSRAATSARGVSRTLKKGGDLDAAREQVETLQAELTRLDEELRSEMEALDHRLDATTTPLTPREIRPTRTGTRVEWMALGWV